MGVGPTGMHAWLDLLVRLSRAPVVSIASIRGRARGAGSEFVLACDLRFASRENTLLGQFEVGTGVVPGGGPMARLSRLVGRGRALEILLVADDLDGPRAEQYGYVNRVIADDELDDEVDAIASRLARFDHDAIARTKSYVDQVTLPADNELPPALADFFELLGRPAQQAQFARLEALGLNVDSDLERSLGRRVVESLPTRELRPAPARTRSSAAPWPARGGSGSRACANTLRRCHSTVRGLRNSRAPISGLDSPSRASCAIWRSCAVSSSRVSTVRLRTFSPVASSSLRARSAKASMPIVANMVVRGAQLRARVDAAILAAQPLAVEQVGAGELGTQPGAAQPLDRLAVEALGGSPSLSRARERASMPSAQSLRATAVAAARRSSACARQLRLVAPGGGFDQLAQRPGGDEQLRRVVARVLAAASASS